jgi:hypothetical protein
MKTIAFFLTLTYTSLSLANTCPTTIVDEGSPAPCTGYILSQNAIEEAAKLPKRISLLEEKLVIKDNILDAKEEKLQVYMQGVENKDKTIVTLSNALVEKDKNEALKIGIAVGSTALATALLCIGLAFAFSAASKIQVSVPSN